MHVNFPGETSETPRKIGEAHFPHCGLSLDVFDFRTGDRGDERYDAVMVTKIVAQFVAVLSGDDCDTFEIQDHQGWVSLACTVKVPGGPYDGNVSYIEATAIGHDALQLLCWFRV